MFLVSPDPGNAQLLREAWTVVIVYLGTLAHAYSYGFSAVAIPDIRNEMREANNVTNSLITPIIATDEQLSWFGENKLFFPINKPYDEVLGAVCSAYKACKSL